MPVVPPFPLSVFPPKVADYWAAAAQSLAVPVDYVAVPGMTLLGTAVGRSRSAQVKTGYQEFPSFWTVVVAPPGSTKSASLSAARGPMTKAEARWMAEYHEALAKHSIEMERYAAKLKEWQSSGCTGEPPIKPEKPKLRQAFLDSTTTEAAAKVLADNPRGIVVVKDEMIGFMRSMNQYRSGGKG